MHVPNLPVFQALEEPWKPSLTVRVTLNCVKSRTKTTALGPLSINSLPAPPLLPFSSPASPADFPANSAPFRTCVQFSIHLSSSFLSSAVPRFHTNPRSQPHIEGTRDLFYRDLPEGPLQPHQSTTCACEDRRDTIDTLLGFQKRRSSDSGDQGLLGFFSPASIPGVWLCSALQCNLRMLYRSDGIVPVVRVSISINSAIFTDHLLRSSSVKRDFFLMRKLLDNLSNDHDGAGAAYFKQTLYYTEDRTAIRMGLRSRGEM
ncbi:hypothetical protein BGZ60DRAFT_30387 [Tricladium varicosporioides]|nr:hypothetical protein BGZ60DRAFT_30387 [Hymenoscyphus varicosporioides]